MKTEKNQEVNSVMSHKNHEMEQLVKALMKMRDSEKSAGEYEVRLREVLDDYIVFSKNRLPYGE